MLFNTLLISAFSLLVSAQFGANPIVPIEGSINAGQPLTIKWQPNTQGTVSLTLRWGAAQNLEKGTPIASGIPNSGTYTWTPPKELKAGTDYAIEIKDSAGTPNYSPQFSISSSGSGLSSTAVSSTTSASTTSSKSSSSTTTTGETSTSNTTTSKVSKAATSSSIPKNAGEKVGGSAFAPVMIGAGLIAAAF